MPRDVDKLNAEIAECQAKVDAGEWTVSQAVAYTRDVLCPRYDLQVDRDYAESSALWRAP